MAASDFLTLLHTPLCTSSGGSSSYWRELARGPRIPVDMDNSLVPQNMGSVRAWIVTGSSLLCPQCPAQRPTYTSRYSEDTYCGLQFAILPCTKCLQVCLSFLAITSQLAHWGDCQLKHVFLTCAAVETVLTLDLCHGFFWIYVQYLKLVTVKFHHVRSILGNAENLSRRIHNRWEMVVASREIYWVARVQGWKTALLFSIYPFVFFNLELCVYFLKWQKNNKHRRQRG